MKKVTLEDIIERKRERLNQNSKKGLIRRNTWGIEQSLVSKQSITMGPPACSLTKEDLEAPSVRLAAGCITRILNDIKTLDSFLAMVDKEDIPKICEKLNIDGGIAKILESEDVSGSLKWEIIYNIDKITKE